MRVRRAWWLVLAAVFLLAAGYSATVARARHAPPGGAVGAPGDAGASAPAPVPSPTVHGDGLSDSHDGYRIEAVTLPTGRGPAVPVAFRILGPDGLPATGYQLVQAKTLHLYLIRDDLHHYQHLHPTLAGGVWSTAVGIPDGGAYRLYAEFTPEGRAGTGHPTVLGLPFVIPGDTTFVPVPAPAPGADAGGYTVTRADGVAHLRAGKSEILRLRVTDPAGAPARALEQYLGAYAHMSAFEVLTQGLVHLHPAVPAAGGPPPDGVLTFHAQFANRGEQRLFLQFQAGGQLRQAAFTVFVT
jgi:hypothetical protein